MPVIPLVLALLALVATTTSGGVPPVDDDDNLYIIHEFDAAYFERNKVNADSAGVPKTDPVYTVEYVTAKEQLDAEREFSKKYGVSIGYLRKVQQQAQQGRVVRIEEADSDSPSTIESATKQPDPEFVPYEPAASPPPAAIDGTNCNSTDGVPKPHHPWKAPTRVKATNRPDSGAALVVLVVVVIAVILTAFIVIMWGSYSCLV